MALEEYWVLVLLAFARTVAFIQFTPFLKNIGLPVMAKAGLALGLSIFVASSQEPIAVENMIHFAGLIFIEVIIGFLLAYLVELIVGIVRIAGAIVDLDMGLSSPFSDINSGNSTPLMSLFYYYFLLVLLSTGILGKIFSGYLYTFQLDISKQLFSNGKALDFFIETFTYMFFGALQIALPFMIATFLINVGMLLMSKTVDKMNILLNVFGVKIVATLALIFLAIPTLLIVFQQVNVQLTDRFMEAIGILFERKH